MSTYPFSGYQAANHSSVTPVILGPGMVPLNLIANIISFLDDDVQALSRMCRSSRVLYYMTLPQLWKNVVLTSHNQIRYKDELPEGFGSASPFSMGLNALVTRNVSSLVRTLTLEGDWTALDLEQYSRVGRLSESAMILNIAVRAAVDRCTLLEKFRWDLDTRLLPNVYSGLTSLKNLTSLRLRFPSTRAPQPTTEIPPLPRLRSLILTHYDPLCYPDDISRLLLHATKLEVLHMHFSPRMRDCGEPSVHFSHFFRQNVSARRKLHIRSMGIYNLFAQVGNTEILDVIDPSTIVEFTALNTFGRDEDVANVEGGAMTSFFDSTWQHRPEADFPPPKAWRLDQLHRTHANQMGAPAKGMERLYLVNARREWKATGERTATSAEISARLPSSAVRSSSATGGSINYGTPVSSSSSSSSMSASSGLRDLYFDNICIHLGPTLRHLIFPARWPLSTNQLARLIRSCPHLTQLSCSMAWNNFETMRMLVPFLSELWAIRVLAPCQAGAEGEAARQAFARFVAQDDALHAEKLSVELARGSGAGGQGDFPRLRYVGIGDKTWQIGGVYEMRVGGEERRAGEDAEQGTEEVMLRRRIKRISEADVKDVEIWAMDSLDVVEPEGW